MTLIFPCPKCGGVTRSPYRECHKCRREKLKPVVAGGLEHRKLIGQGGYRTEYISGGMAWLKRSVTQ